MVHATNYVHDQFRDKDSPADLRRRHVVLDLGARTVSLPELRTLSPRVAAQYSKKHEKTISRDVNTLLKMDLIVQVGGTMRARRETILAFLPPRRVVQPSADK